jgi:hypothetical protein
MARHAGKYRNMAANYRLKTALVLKGLTQLQLGEKFGMPEHDISWLETGRTQAKPRGGRRLGKKLRMVDKRGAASEDCDASR